MVALLLVGSAILLFSCKSETKREEELLDAIKTKESENLTIIMSENGRKSYLFKTPLLEGYTLGRDPYREFRKGISITTFQDDSLTTVNAVLVANYAIYYENRQLWEAKGDVVVTKSDGTRLYTQQLFWNSKTKRIYSNVDTKLVTETDEIVGEGFESDEEMTQPRFRHWKGRLQVDTEQLQSGSGDDATDEAKGENNESQKRDADAPESKAKVKPMPKSMPKSLPQSRPQSKTKPQSKQRPSGVEPGMQPVPQGPAPKMGGAKMPPAISGKRPNSMREQGVKLDGNQELQTNSLKTN
jgi:LPS export ABC transporter protein LptC